MTTREPRCRGWLASGVVAYCDDRQAQGLVEQASDDLRSFLSKPASRREDWVPIDWLIEALTLVDRVAGNGDEGLGWPLGVFLASREVGAVPEFAARLLRPPLIISMAPGLWGAHFRNAGRVSARGRGERDVAIRLVDVPFQSRLLCQAIGGWMEGFLRLGRRSDICVREVACAHRGAANCEYTASWVD